MPRKPSSGIPLLLSSTAVGFGIVAVVLFILNWINALAGGIA